MEPRTMYGRRVITTDVEEITAGNVVDVLRDAMSVHELNRSEIDYLWKYYKGNQPILTRQKTVRPEICNRIVENRANEIVSFKVGYLCGEPIQYVGRSNEESTTAGIGTLNEYMFLVDKPALDQEVVEWGMICGTAYRMVMANDAYTTDCDEAPFEIYTLDPRNSFVVYSTDVKRRRMMGVKYNTDEYGFNTYSVYTDNQCFIIEGDKVVSVNPHGLGVVNIYEFPANNARLGSFEICLPLLDAINNIESNRMDGVEQFIQAFVKFINCDITAEDFSEDDVFEIRKKVGMVFQNPDNQIVANVVEEDVAFGPENLGLEREEIRRRVISSLALVGMTDYAHHAPHKLSGGQKQRIAIAGIIAMKPGCIIFDESTAMLDPIGRQDIVAIMERLNKEEGLTVLNITHYMDEAARADRIIVMNDGKVVLDDTPKSIFQRVDYLHSIGLEAPQTVELKNKLSSLGIVIKSDSLSEDEIASEIEEYIKNLKGS